MRRVLVLGFVVLVALTAADRHEGPAQAAMVCTTSATVSASLTVGGPFDGLWKYTITGSWDTGGEGLSHISFLVKYLCPCCNVTGGIVFFDTPAGTSTGEDANGDPCTAEYTGSGNLCDEDPTIPSPDPAIKFDQNETGCQSGQTGSGEWCFYSPLPPLPSDTYVDAVAVKYGNNVCFGTLTGEMPDCTDCGVVPTEPSSWGKIKAKYEKK